MYDRLLGFLFGCLEPEECHEIHAALATDDKLREQLEILRRSVRPLECDREPVTPPKDLATKTCQNLRGCLEERGERGRPQPPPPG